MSEAFAPFGRWSRIGDRLPMRDNSGSGKGKNNMRDPTMRDHQGKDRPEQKGRDFTEKSPFNIGEKARDRDEQPSPDDRARGETASTDRAAPVDR